MSSARGPSPRRRGRLEVPLTRAHRLRSIPAWAGEPAIHKVFADKRAVHPRVGGGAAGTRAATQAMGLQWRAVFEGVRVMEAEALEVIADRQSRRAGR